MMVGHLTSFPAGSWCSRSPDHRGTEWPMIFDAIYGTLWREGYHLNHARVIRTAVSNHGPLNFNDEVGLNINGWQLQVNAMETVNSSANQTDIMQLFHVTDSAAELRPPDRAGRLQRFPRRRPALRRPGSHLHPGSDDISPGDINVCGRSGIRRRQGHRHMACSRN